MMSRDAFSMTMLARRNARPECEPPPTDTRSVSPVTSRTVSIETVRLVTGDTDRVSVGGGSHSGRALRLASIVMLKASRDIIAKGLQIASHVLEAAPADIEFADGRFRVKGTDRLLGIFEAAAEALRRNDLPDDLRDRKSVV